MILMKQVTYNVTGMHCPSCVTLIELTVNDVPGVEKCNVDLASKTISLTYDETQTSLSEFNEKLQGYGYMIAQ